MTTPGQFFVTAAWVGLTIADAAGPFSGPCNFDDSRSDSGNKVRVIVTKGNQTISDS